MLGRKSFLALIMGMMIAVAWSPSPVYADYDPGDCMEVASIVYSYMQNNYNCDITQQSGNCSNLSDPVEDICDYIMSANSWTYTQWGICVDVLNSTPGQACGGCSTYQQSWCNLGCSFGTEPCNTGSGMEYINDWCQYNNDCYKCIYYGIGSCVNNGGGGDGPSTPTCDERELDNYYAYGTDIDGHRVCLNVTGGDTAQTCSNSPCCDKCADTLVEFCDDYDWDGNDPQICQRCSNFNCSGTNPAGYWAKDNSGNLVCACTDCADATYTKTLLDPMGSGASTTGFYSVTLYTCALVCGGPGTYTDDNEVCDFCPQGYYCSNEDGCSDECEECPGIDEFNPNVPANKWVGYSPEPTTTGTGSTGAGACYVPSGVSWTGSDAAGNYTKSLNQNCYYTDQ